ncbi:NADH-quinone oxidoreductase subunit L [Candidatus Tisiphia endosymbiont of Ptychoptera albimana]|uniref:NADH-quinone oxidoreductase subunit L n=1 Tax=Candidatus Tisiphia endosymbiont of Ptychoptera albimana TaxID=3066260 RepID=UPI001D71422C|nr:NADH-quinone oxidoreductase subunit L [Rickettsia endosymbiont of Sericostoma sp. HW-2014]
MVNALAIFTVMLPLISGMINGLFCQCFSKKQAACIATIAISLAAIFASFIFYNVAINKAIIHLILAKWLVIGEMKIDWAIYVDQLTAIMFIVVTWISAVVHIYSLGYMADDEGLPKFLSFLSLFTFFMLALVSADNFVQLFFGWEGVGLCSYLLIGFWYQKEAANKAAIKAFIVNRIGDFAFIVGIITIIVYFGVVDFASVFDKAQLLSNIQLSIWGFTISIIDIVCLLLFLGCMGKSAQIGLHIWLPDAMEGPTPVSALIHAATMVTAGVFLVARCSYLFEYSVRVLSFIAIIGGITCIFAATIAIVQNDIKKIIAYSTCSQLGYMFLACGVSAYNAGIFHLVTHAFFKALLFLSAGSVIHACHQQDIFKMGGLKDKMPVTYCNFLIGSLALIGIYPLAGFYSKDAILELAYSSGGVIGTTVFILGIVAAILTAIYSMKIILLVFHGKTRLTIEQFNHAHESPNIMNLPLNLLVVGSFVAGMIGHYILALDKPNGYFLDSIFNIHIYQRLANHPPIYIKLLPMVLGLMGIVLGIYLYKNIIDKVKITFMRKLLIHKYYFDEVYDLLIVRLVANLSKLLNLIDQRVIDRFGPSNFAKTVNYFGILVSRSQTGYIFNYTMYIVLFVVAYITFFIVLQQIH